MRHRLLRSAIVVALVLISGCVGAPRRRPSSPPPPAARPERPAPAAPAKPATAALLGVSPGPAATSLGLTAANAGRALAAFRLSCPVLLRRTDASGLTRPDDWRSACDDAAVRLDVDGPDFFAAWFETATVGDGTAFATGYYEPEIEGAREHLPGYDVPVYRRPPDLVDMNEGGRKQRGRLEGGAVVPYYDRAEIDAGALAGRGLEIGWARDPIEFFFLQIQGSGRLVAPDGTVVRIGYDGQNGRDYVGIGKTMRDRGLIGPGTDYATSMQGTMAWLRGHPDEGRQMMELNRSFVFFREIVGAGPIGALGVPVTGLASVAADPRFVPLGAPILLSLDRAEASGLWVAQDTGGAIKGPNRVDTFWGAGVAARQIAGGMSGRGRALLLLPRGTLARLHGGPAASGAGGGPRP